MALKGDRVIIEENIKRTCEAAGSRGLVLVQHTAGSGIALGDSAGKSTWVANPSGHKVTGMLLNDVVSIDETRYHRNFHKDETKVSERCRQLIKGSVTVNNVTGTPAYGDTAYLDSSGTLIPTLHATGGLVARPKVGMFLGGKDADGYVEVALNLPVV